MADAVIETGAQATHHWLGQRRTAGSNLVLMLWFMVSLALLPGYDYATITAWLASPLAAVPMVLLVVTTFYHFTLGVQVVIEDYQHNETLHGLLSGGSPPSLSPRARCRRSLSS